MSVDNRKNSKSYVLPKGGKKYGGKST